MNYKESDITGFNTHIHYVDGIPIDCNPKSYKYILELEKENKRLKQWGKDKDTRNSRQRIANKKLLEENRLLKQALNEIRLYINNTITMIIEGKPMKLSEETSGKDILKIIDRYKGSEK